MLEYATSLRLKVILLLYTSTGIRVGAFETIQLKHLESKDTEKGKLYELTIYPEEKEQYYTFCSPECASVIDEYIEYRKRAGEKVGPESYLIRKDFNRNVKDSVNDTEPIKRNTIAELVHALLLKSGIRTKKEDKEAGYRYNHQIDHAFRKWFTNQVLDSGIGDTHRYLLEGHALPNNDKNYVRTLKKTLLQEYLKAVDNLTIDKSYVLQKEVTKLEDQRDKIEVEVSRNSQDMKLILEDNRKLRKEIEFLKNITKNLVKEIQGNLDKEGNLEKMEQS
jgi:hypothetical protein